MGCYSCNKPTEEKFILKNLSSGVQLLEICDTSIMFANQAPGCEFELWRDDERMAESNKTRYYQYYKAFANRVVFYDSFKYGTTAGWFKIKNGKTIELDRFRTIYDSVLKSNSALFYRNGLVLAEGNVDSVILNYGELAKIDTPEFTAGFGIYKMALNGELEFESNSFDFDIYTTDGLYYITSPGLINHYEYIVESSD
jgi:hypothetical protein